MDASLNEKVKQSIQNLRDKKSRIYFLIQDTKGNAKASVRLIYQMAKTLLDSGFNPIILHEKNDYVGVTQKNIGNYYFKKFPEISNLDEDLQKRLLYFPPKFL